ncbi:MAG TPA: hypothetical protein VFN97_17850 [Actinospica sp.]|nr:hypothetical protein [Actinospica sp.]
MRSWVESPFVLTSTGLIVVVTLVVGAGLYRRGERGTLGTLITVPAAMLLGIYAGDHDERPLGLVAFALLVGGMAARTAIRRRRDGGGGECAEG